MDEPTPLLAEFRRLWEEREEVEAIVRWLLASRRRHLAAQFEASRG